LNALRNISTDKLSEPRIVIRQDMIKIRNNATVYVEPLTGRLMIHQHKKATIDNENVKTV